MIKNRNYNYKKNVVNLKVIVVIVVLITLIIVLFQFNIIDNEGSKYEEAKVKIGEFYTAYNSYKSIDNVKIEDAKAYGNLLI